MDLFALQRFMLVCVGLLVGCRRFSFPYVVLFLFGSA